jgi:glycosyltransferase involved in cell wall biosynthesis
MKILTLCRLATLKVYDHLCPMLMNEQLGQMVLVRYAELPQAPAKLRQVAFADESAGGSDGLPLLRRLKNQWDLLRLAWETAKREKPDLIYGIFFTTNGLLAWLIAKLLRRKVMVSFIGTDFNKHLLEYPIRHLLWPFVRSCDVLTVFDEPARQILLARGLRPEQVFVIPHGIEMSRFQPSTVPKDIDAVFCGMFVALKEISRLIAAWRGVVDQRPGAKLALVGDGPLRAELEAQVAALGLGENVVFTGWVQDVSPYLHRAKIFCNFSNQEGVPHAMLEAMALGLVPVVTAVGGVPSIITQGQNGLLIPNPAPADLAAQTLLALLNDEARYERMSRACVAVRDSQSYEAVSRAWTPAFDYLANLTG